MGYARSSFRDSENFLRKVFGWDGTDIQLILKQFKSYFVTFEKPPGLYSIKDVPEVVYTMGDYGGNCKLKTMTLA